MPDLREKMKEAEQDYDRFLLRDADLPEPPAGLDGKIMRRVKRYERRVLVIKIAGFGTLSLASAAGVVMAYFNLMSAANQSGFFAFASLPFSDFSVAMSNFQDFAFSILESFPVFSAAFLVAGIIVVVWSAAHFIDDIKIWNTNARMSF